MENPMKLILSLIAASLILGGCIREANTSVPGLGSRVLTVDEFVAQPDLRNKVSAVCANDPGRMGMTANCVNVRRADHIASMGTAASLRIDLSH
jgi:outer membrane murein-binding lipoprotein Lpp